MVKEKLKHGPDAKHSVDGPLGCPRCAELRRAALTEAQRQEIVRQNAKFNDFLGRLFATGKVGLPRAKRKEKR